jgi:phosphate transport system ATP-binding protein
MNDLIPEQRSTGQVLYHGQDIYGDGVDPVEVRRRIGMVFQRANPFRSRSTTTSPGARACSA